MSRNRAKRVRGVLGAIAIWCLGALLAACSSSDWGSQGAAGGSVGAGGSAGAGGSTVSGDGSTGCPGWVPTQACKDCIDQSCSVSAVDALGPGWKSDNPYGGKCTTYAQCWCACPPGAATCAQTCWSQATTACQQAFGPFAACQSQNCSALCPH